MSKKDLLGNIMAGVFYGGLAGYVGYMGLTIAKEMTKEKRMYKDWERPKNWQGYYPRNSIEAIHFPVYSPHCAANHKYPCPNPLCKGYPGTD
jgi:hypothetical protein